MPNASPRMNFPGFVIIARSLTVERFPIRYFGGYLIFYLSSQFIYILFSHCCCRQRVFFRERVSPGNLRGFVSQAIFIMQGFFFSTQDLMDLLLLMLCKLLFFCFFVVAEEKTKSYIIPFLVFFYFVQRFAIARVIVSAHNYFLFIENSLDQFRNILCYVLCLLEDLLLGVRRAAVVAIFQQVFIF